VFSCDFFFSRKRSSRRRKYSSKV